MAETQFNPTPDYYLERIGGQEYKLPTDELDVFDDVRLWGGNPRLVPYLSEGIPDDGEMEAILKQTNGYDALKSPSRILDS